MDCVCVSGGWSMRTANWLACFFAASLAGCSLYPIPDDVISFDTEYIVRHARCEMRSVIIERAIDRLAEKRLIAASATEGDIIKLTKDTEAKVQRLERLNAKRPRAKQIDIAKVLSDVENEIRYVANIAMVYTFDFHITENNRAEGSAAFKLPFTPPQVLDVFASGSVNLTRHGQRQFSASDRWGNLITNTDLCKHGWPQHGNIVYPLDGSIGVGRVVKTFLDIARQGGAKDNFVDTLIFTTQVGAGANAAIKLDAVPHSFRLVSATAGLNGSRIDIHKMIVSLAFPRPIIPAITGVERYPGDLNAPFERPADWRARYNLCVADARQREDTLKMLRLEAPEVYCIRYADSFAPQYGPDQEQSVTISVRTQPAQPRATDQADPPAGPATETQRLIPQAVPVPVYVVPVDRGARRGVRPNAPLGGR